MPLLTDRVKLIAAQAQGIHEVSAVEAGRFRTDFPSADGEVFVYGREVKDFRQVDYEAIAMLNVSATQELARRWQAQEEENAALKKQVAIHAAKLELAIAAQPKARVRGRNSPRGNEARRHESNRLPARSRRCRPGRPTSASYTNRHPHRRRCCCCTHTSKNNRNA